MSGEGSRQRQAALVAGLLATTALYSPSSARAQLLLPNAQQQFLDANGKPLGSGFVYMYVPGTTTPAPTWQDAGLSVLNTNPITLDSGGYARIWGAGSYRQVVTDLNGSLQWDQVTSSVNAATFVPTNVALKSIQSPVNGQAAFRFGYYSGGDGGEATYVFSSSSTCTDDGGSCIQPNVGSGRWLVSWTPGLSGAAWGMACNASHDDTQNLQNYITAVQSEAFPSTQNGGGIATLPPGFCIISATISITNGLVIRGQGSGVSSGSGNSDGTVIRWPNSNGDVFAIASDGAVEIRDLTIDFGGSYQSAGAVAGGAAAISLTGSTSSSSNRSSKFDDLFILGANNGIRIVNGSGWIIKDSTFQDYADSGVKYLASSAFPDGQWSRSNLTNNIFWDLNRGSSLAGLQIQGGGDIAAVANKFLGSQYGIYGAISQGPTGTLLTVNNSYEEQKTSPFHVGQLTSGKNYGNVIVTGSEFSSITNIPTLSGMFSLSTGTSGNSDPKWFKNLVLNGNLSNSVINTPVPFVNIQDGTQGVVSNNVLDNNGVVGATGIVISGSATNYSEVMNQFSTPSGNYGASGGANCVVDVSSGPLNVGCNATGNLLKVGDSATNTVVLNTDGSHNATLGTTTATAFRLAYNAIAEFTLSNGLAMWGLVGGSPVHIGTEQLVAPALTSCGTNPSIDGTDTAGEVTMGTGNPTGCVITFKVAYVSKPYCWVTWKATPLATQTYDNDNVAITITQTATSSNKINYGCLAKAGG